VPRDDGALAVLSLTCVDMSFPVSFGETFASHCAMRNLRCDATRNIAMRRQNRTTEPGIRTAKR